MVQIPFSEPIGLEYSMNAGHDHGKKDVLLPIEKCFESVVRGSYGGTRKKDAERVSEYINKE